MSNIIVADLVVLSMGARSNVSLAEKAGIKTGEYGAISTHPLLSAAPTVYPLITASQSVLAQIS